jgi:hypothetical protein
VALPVLPRDKRDRARLPDLQEREEVKMKLICKVDRKEEVRGFTNFVAVVEYADGKLFEVDVTAEGYSDRKRIDITCQKVRMNPATLSVSCSDTHVAEILLAVELCNFVRLQFPHLANLNYTDGRFSEATK